MNYTNYLTTFQNAANQLDKKVLNNKSIEIAVGEILNAVFLKLYKKSWANPSQNPSTSDSRIFFSIWTNDVAIKEQKIFYNIHAFKLRHLKGYSIQSRQFANIFRESFKRFDKKWENVSVKFGPLTLMEGWVKVDYSGFQDEIVALANNFIEIENLIDDTLTHFK